MRFAELLLVRPLALQVRARVPRVVALFVRKNKNKKSTAKLSYANFRFAKVVVAELCSGRASTMINSLG